MSTTRTPVERTTRIATTVDELSDAWAFVMAHIDECGHSQSVKISPVWSHSGDGDGVKFYEVVVSGMVEDEEGAG